MFQVVRDEFSASLKIDFGAFGRNTLTGRLGAFFAYLTLTLLCDLPLLFVYSQVNIGVLSFLNYVEDVIAGRSLRSSSNS